MVTVALLFFKAVTYTGFYVIQDLTLISEIGLFAKDKQSAVGCMGWEPGAGSVEALLPGAVLHLQIHTLSTGLGFYLQANFSWIFAGI